MIFTKKIFLNDFQQTVRMMISVTLAGAQIFNGGKKALDNF